MQAGRLRFIVEIQQRTSVRDAYGAETVTWAPVHTIRADVRFKSGMKQVNEMQIFNAQSIEMYIRYKSDITEEMRVLLNGRTYKIASINEVDYRKTLKIDIERIAEAS